MRPLLYLLSALLVLPVAALALFFEAVAAIADTPGRSLWRALWDAAGRALRLLDALGGPRMLPVVALGAVLAATAFVALAWSTRYRWVGCALIAAVGAAGLLVVVRSGAPHTGGEALFLAPALLGIGVAVWQLATDPRLRAVGDTVP
jgi:hypothetical protein